MNQNGAMVDRSDLVEGFADETQDRDVIINDVNDDGNPDVIVAATYGEQPRVYLNLGCCNAACSPSNPCAPANEVQCTPSAAFWCGLKYDPAENRLPSFSPAPFFCGVAAGDVDNDGCPDLYFVEYDNILEDRLLLNTKVGGACTGFFTDVTVTPSMRLCPNGSPCFYESEFRTGVQIIDMNLDGFKDIVKSEGDSSFQSPPDNGELSILYNNPLNPGHFNLRQQLSQEQQTGFGELAQTYMFEAKDMNQDLGVDLYVVKTNRDSFVLNECTDPLSDDCHRPSDGAVNFLAVQTVSAGKLLYPGGNVHMVDLNGDTFADATVADLDVRGTSEGFQELRITRTNVNSQNPMTVTIADGSCPGGTCDRCMWNTHHTFDFAWLDVNGDLKLDLWSGHGAGNNLFLWEVPSDCDGDGRPDRCGSNNPPAQGAIAKCCLPTGTCVNRFEACCATEGGRWLGSTGTTCETSSYCPVIEE